MMNIASSFMALSNGIMAFDIDLPLQTPFLFDPTKGNLLIDIRNFTGCAASLYNNAAGSGTDAVSRIVKRCQSRDNLCGCRSLTPEEG